jgi:competence protein ComGC
MKYLGRAQGSTVVELLVALFIIGALASLAMPQYMSYVEHAKAAQCAENRHVLESAESACALRRGKPCLSTGRLIASGYLNAPVRCPSGGKYVWLGRDFGHPQYPQLACSKHFLP